MGGQDNPAGLSSPPGGKITQLGYPTPRGVRYPGWGARYTGTACPGGASCPGGGGKINCYSGYCMVVNSVGHCLLCNNIGIKHGFPCVNVCHVPRELLKTEAEVFNIPRDLANVNVLDNNV